MLANFGGFTHITVTNMARQPAFAYYAQQQKHANRSKMARMRESSKKRWEEKKRLEEKKRKLEQQLRETEQYESEGSYQGEETMNEHGAWKRGNSLIVDNVARVRVNSNRFRTSCCILTVVWVSIHLVFHRSIIQFHAKTSHNSTNLSLFAQTTSFQ